MTSDATSSELSRIKAESSAWAVARDRGLTADEQDRFLDWMAADPRHSEWFAQHQQGLHNLKLLAHWRPEHSIGPNPDLLTAVAKRKPGANLLRWLAPLGLAAVLALAAVWWLRPRPDAAPAETFAVRKVLEDGSKIDLGHGAEVEVAYTPQRRDVRLLRGEANFTVSRDAERPFTVSASGVAVRAVGTAFMVSLRERSVAVVVTEGSVNVPGLEVPGLETGQRTVIPLSPPVIATVEAASPAELARLRGWRPNQLEFNETPLEEVVAELNAWNQVQVLVEDPALAALPLGAALRTDNVEGFVRILEANFGAKAETRGATIVIRRAH